MLVGFLWSTSTVACKIRNTTSLQTIKRISSCNSYTNICVNMYLHEIYVKISAMGTMSSKRKKYRQNVYADYPLENEFILFFSLLCYIMELYKIRSPSNSMIIICLYELSRLEIESSFLSLNFWMSNKMNDVTGTISIPTKH